MREVSNKTHNAELKLFLEVELGLVMFVFICEFEASLSQHVFPEKIIIIIAINCIVLQDLRPISPPDKTKEDILLFFKLYDPEKKELRY